MCSLGALRRRTHRAAVEGLGAIAERGAPTGPLPHAPVLIVGPPRSGTTLLGQAMVAGLDLGWFSGWHNALAGAPGLVPTSWLGAPATHFRSDHGRLGSWREPHEAATWWYRFFPRDPQAVASEEADPAALERLRRSMAAVLARAGRPVVWKNVVNSVRLEPILTAIPEAIVIEARRDDAAAAASILRARASQAGGVDQWWSVRPAGWEALASATPEAQVQGQIDGVRAALDQAQASHPATAWLNVDYADLVNDPRAAIDRIGDHIERGDAGHRRLDRLPATFA